MINEKSAKERYLKLSANRYGISLVGGYPFDRPTRIRFGQMQALISKQCPRAFTFIPLSQIHVTILRGKSLPFPLTQVRKPPPCFIKSVHRIHSQVIYWDKVEICSDGAVRVKVSSPDEFYDVQQGGALAAMLSKAYGVDISPQHTFWATIANVNPDSFFCQTYEMVSKLNTLLPYKTLLKSIQLVYYRDLRFFDTEIIASYPLPYETFEGGQQW